MLISSMQLPVAQYIYDPSGKTLSNSGPLADANSYRFSSKEHHVNSGIYYYGRRFYKPNLQRWLNRDPIGILGGVNLYTFVGNDPIIYVDPNGELGFVIGTAVVVGVGALVVTGVIVSTPTYRTAAVKTVTTIWTFTPPKPLGACDLESQDMFYCRYRCPSGIRINVPKKYANSPCQPWIKEEW
jgi:RHS repeat-associated protein